MYIPTLHEPCHGVPEEMLSSLLLQLLLLLLCCCVQPQGTVAHSSPLSENTGAL